MEVPIDEELEGKEVEEDDDEEEEEKKGEKDAEAGVEA